MAILNKAKNALSKISKKIRRKRFGTIAEEWLEYKRISVKDSTYYNYKTVIEKILKPRLNDADVSKLNDFGILIDDLSQKYAPKTVRDITNILKSILSYYESEYGKEVKYKKINVPKLEKENLKILTAKEKTRLENYCIKENSLKSLGVLICLNTGMRIGEICALKWENIDLSEKNIYIKHTMQRVYDAVERKSKVIIDKPKTQCSIRTIPINKKIYDILYTMRKKYSKDSFFLTGEENKHIEPRTYHNIFKEILKGAKVKSHKFHILRHTFATNCMEVGMDIKTLSEILGHSNVEITLNIYVHSSRKLMKKYLEKL